MEKNIKYSQFIVSLVLVCIVFGIGYSFGSKNSYKPNISVSNVTSDKNVDFDPYWKAWSILDEKFAKASTTSESNTNQNKIWGSISGLAASYKDPYTVFFPPVESKNFGEEISGSFGGVGMEVDNKSGVLVVVAPLKNTPAYKAGVKSGDKILSIDGKSASSLSAEEAVKFIRGKEGTQVVIEFGRDGVKDPITKSITRAVIEIPTVDTKIVDDKVFVISLYNFSAISANSFRMALREFVESKKDKLIIDLRGNPGGYLEAAIDMASWFLPTGKVVVTEEFGDKSKETEVYKSKGYDVFNDNLKMVVLIDQGSASASEILAGALQDHSKAKIVGTRSFGKGSVQELLPITKDTSLKVTVAHWFTPSGKSISNGGLAPDIEVKLTPENTKNGNDPILNTALKYFDGLK